MDADAFILLKRILGIIYLGILGIIDLLVLKITGFTGYVSNFVTLEKITVYDD